MSGIIPTSGQSSDMKGDEKKFNFGFHIAIPLELVESEEGEGSSSVQEKMREDLHKVEFSNAFGKCVFQATATNSEELEFRARLDPVDVRAAAAYDFKGKILIICCDHSMKTFPLVADTEGNMSGSFPLKAAEPRDTNEFKLILTIEVTLAPVGPNRKEMPSPMKEDLDLTAMSPVVLTVKSPRDIIRMFDDELFTDVVVATDDGNFKAHKAALARSSVFAEIMNDPAWILANTGIVATPGFKFETIYELVGFLYIGVARNIDKAPFNLLSASISYNVRALKEACIDHIKSATILNSADDLVRVYQMPNSDLKKLVIEFIGNNRHEFMSSEEWKEMKTNHPELAFELLESIITKGT